MNAKYVVHMNIFQIIKNEIKANENDRLKIRKY